MKPVWIVSARRTPQGRFLGSLARQSAIDLGVVAAQATLQDLDKSLIDSVIVGNVLGAGLGMNVARQIGVKLGLPDSTPAFTVNMMCASGMQSVLLAAQSIQAGSAQMVLCGGTESMSNAPYVLDRARTGYKLGNGIMIDTLLRDGLTDAFSGEHMGLTAERIAQKYGITREEQDAFAALSQSRYFDAQAAGHFDQEIVPLEDLEVDEHPRATTLEKLAALRTPFRKGGSVTAGNASGVNDGAAALMVASEEAARRHGLTPVARILGGATAGVEPRVMGIGPVPATRKLCARLGLSPQDFGVIELNEAFAAQGIAVLRELGLPEDAPKPPAMEIIAPFMSPYDFFEGMGIRTWPNGHGHTGVHRQHRSADF